MRLKMYWHNLVGMLVYRTQLSHSPLDWPNASALVPIHSERGKVKVELVENETQGHLGLPWTHILKQNLGVQDSTLVNLFHVYMFFAVFVSHGPLPVREARLTKVKSCKTERFCFNLIKPTPRKIAPWKKTRVWTLCCVFILLSIYCFPKYYFTFL